MAGLIFTISNLAVWLTCLALIVILLRYGTKKIHYIWAVFNFIVGVWGFGAFLIGLARDAATALLYWKVALFGSIFAPVLFYHVVVLLGGLKRKAFLTSLYIYSTFLYALVILDLVGLSISKLPNFVYYVQATDARWAVITGVWACMICWAIFELYRLQKNSAGMQLIQYQYLFAASLAGFTGGLLNTLPFFGLAAFPAANVVMCLYTILSTYAILRHKLLEIDVVVKKTLVFAGIFVSAYAVFASFAFLGQMLLERFAIGNRWITVLPSIVVMTLIVRPIENLLINLTDRYLFQKRYDYKELLRTFTAEVLTVLDLTRLVKLTVNKLVSIIKLNSCAVLLFDEGNQRFNVEAHYGIRDPYITLIRPDGIITFIEHTHSYILMGEFTEKKIAIPPAVRDVINKLDAELLVSMVLHNKVIGMLSLGRKKSDEPYTQDDLDIILPLARTLAIAISNAELFKELGKAQAEAAQREKMAVIGTLSAGINHEICNPLGIARGQCEAFLLNTKDGLYKDRSTQDLLTQAESIMAKVIKEVDRATLITKKLSSFAKPAKGEVELVNIDKEIDEVMGLVGYELRLEKIDVVKEIPQHLPHILGDRKQFQEVLFNLLRNASHAISGQGKITIAAHLAGGRVVMDIKDTGSGIPQENVGELFNPFFTTKDPGKGTGLGLFIVRQIVEKNGGRIYLKESTLGQGTTFTLEFPAAEHVERGA